MGGSMEPSVGRPADKNCPLFAPRDRVLRLFTSGMYPLSASAEQVVGAVADHDTHGRIVVTVPLAASHDGHGNPARVSFHQLGGGGELVGDAQLLHAGTRGREGRPRRCSSAAGASRRCRWRRRSGLRATAARMCRETITATSAPRATNRLRSWRADASGSAGSTTTRSDAPLDDWSTPLLAQTKPWRVSVISTGPIWRTIRVDSRSTTSTTAWILLPPGGPFSGERRRLDIRQLDDRPLRLGDDLRRDDDDVAVTRARPRRR